MIHLRGNDDTGEFTPQTDYTNNFNYFFGQAEL